MKIIKISLLIALAILMNSNVSAQEKNTKNRALSPQQKAAAHIAKMKTIIELDEKQEAALNEQLTSFYTDMQALNKEMDAIKEKMRETKKANKEKIKEILTEEQREKLKEARKSEKKKENER